MKCKKLTLARKVTFAQKDVIDEPSFVVIIGTFFSIWATFFFIVMFPSRSSRYSSLAGAILNKANADREWLEGDKSHWYDVNMEGLVGGRYVDTFVEHFLPMDPKDPETLAFVHSSVQKSDEILTQMWHNLARNVMKLFYSQTDINGYLGRGSTFVLSTAQFESLLRKAGFQPSSFRRERLIDLGAGDGAPTERLAPFFQRISATEMSWSMKKRLHDKGIKVLDPDKWDADGEGSYDFVSCLNLLDRCREPVTLLKRIRKSLKDGSGLLLVAIVLPFEAYVEYGSGDGENCHRPSEVLPLQNHDDTSSFVQRALSVARLLEEFGFRLMAWSRVPYLCEGDSTNSLYVLDDAVFLLSTTIEY